MSATLCEFAQTNKRIESCLILFYFEKTYDFILKIPLIAYLLIRILYNLDKLTVVIF